MSAIPVWIQVLQGLLTPAIAGGVGVIAFMQWRTAHQKVMLDLFDRRLKVFETVESAAGAVFRSGRGNEETERSLLTAIAEAKFLFGNDVHDYLEAMWKSYVEMESLAMEIENLHGHERVTAVREKRRHGMAISSFHAEGVKVFGPYLRMDQKRVRTPTEWFRDRNRQRLSYADEKQR
jgi:hypothetical protein